MRQRRFRDWIAGVEDYDSNTILLLFKLNVNYFFTLAVIYCVREVIRENFLGPELVRPHVERRSLLYFDLDVLLLGQHVGVLQTPINKSDNIKADHGEFRLAKLQLVEGQ